MEHFTKILCNVKVLEQFLLYEVSLKEKKTSKNRSYDIII